MLNKIIKILGKYYYVFLEGLGNTLWLSAVVVLLGCVGGILVALLRRTKIKVVDIIMTAFIEIIRGTPVLIQLYFFWVALPKLIPEISDLACILIALVVNASAYISEIFRAGINAVDIGQTEAARSLGMTERHVMSRIVLPQALKNILPALGNEFISTVKGTSLASVFFVGELTTAYKTVQSATFLALESLTIAAAIYFLLNFVLSKLLKILERRLEASD